MSTPEIHQATILVVVDHTKITHLLDQIMFNLLDQILFKLLDQIMTKLLDQIMLVLDLKHSGQLGNFLGLTQPNTYKK